MSTSPDDSSQFNPFAFTDDEPQAPIQAPEPAAAPAATTTPAPVTELDPAPAPAPTRVSTRPAEPAKAETPAQSNPAPEVKATPTAAADTKDAGEQSPEEPTDPAPAEPTDTKGDTDVFARRRKRVKHAAIVLAIVAGWALYTKPWVDLGAASTTPGALAAGTVNEVTDAANDPVSRDLTYAEQYLTEHGTLDGIIIDGAQLAVRGTTMYAVRTIAGTCTVYGLLDGQRIPATPDPTADACKGQIVTVQATLDQAAADTEANASWAAEETLRKAAGAAVAYASRNYVGGQPSMEGLPSSLSGALVMANHGEYVTLRVSYPDVCLETFVTAAGEIGDTNTCS